MDTALMKQKVKLENFDSAKELELLDTTKHIVIGFSSKMYTLYLRTNTPVKVSVSSKGVGEKKYANVANFDEVLDKLFDWE